MDNFTIVIGCILLISIWWNLAVSLKIVNYLKSQKVDARLTNHGIFVRGKIFKYLPVYKEVTKRQEGKVGPLYNEFYVSIMTSAILFVIGVLSV